jgi:hypothetical protein
VSSLLKEPEKPFGDVSNMNDGEEIRNERTLFHLNRQKPSGYPNDSQVPE